MRQLLLIAIALVYAAPLYAYNPITAEPSEAYTAIQVEGDPYVERTYLGNLEDAPDLYEFKTDVAISVKMRVQQRVGEGAVPFGLIMVRQNDADGGVEEIVRQNEPLETWTKERSHSLGMTFFSAPTLQVDIKPGTYRIEVSTPDNKGVYALTLGEESSWSGYFKSIWNALKTQYHFGLSPLSVFCSVYIYATIVVLVAGYGTYRFRKYRKEHYGFAT